MDDYVSSFTLEDIHWGCLIFGFIMGWFLKGVFESWRLEKMRKKDKDESL